MIRYPLSLLLILTGVALILNALFSGHTTRYSTKVNGASSRKLMQLMDEKETDSEDSFDRYHSDLDEIFGRFDTRWVKSPPPPPPHPARYEMCQGIQHKRYKFVRTFDEIKKALAKAKPGDLIEVKSGIYFQGSGAGKSSLIPPDLHVDARGDTQANRRDPREKRLLGTEVRPTESIAPAPEGPRKNDIDGGDDDGFASLYEIYVEQYLLPLIEQDEVSTPSPAPAPKESIKDIEDDDSIKNGEKPNKSKPPKAKPGKNKAAPAPAPSPESEDVELIDVEYENDRYEFDDLEEYIIVDEEGAKAPAPDKEKAPGSRPGPWVSPSGFIDNLHGTEEDPITLCGPKTAVFDGSNGDRGLAAAALRVVRSSHVVVKGFTMQNALKGLDVQKTNSSIFSNITTRYTLQEGIRLRYNSTFNLVHGCNISYTGRLWVGIGEGMYVGTSTRNSIGAGLPKDFSDYNNFTSNYFGEGITAENIDIKEFTTGGVVANNTFNGTSIAGLNGAIAWVAIKGNNYTVADNRGFGTLRGGQGFRVLQKHRGLAYDNSILNNTCLDFELGSFCVFVDSLARNTKVNCNNKRYSTKSPNALQRLDSSQSKRVCNCQIDTLCTRPASNTTTMFIKTLRTTGVQDTTNDATASEFYAQGFPVLPRELIRDLTDSRPSWD